MSYRIALLTFCVFTTACTQTPAEVVFRGQQSFAHGVATDNGHYATGRNPSSYHSVPAYGEIVAEPQQQSAEFSSVGVADLTPPPATAKKKP